jgi:hypothetical protein
MFRKLTIWAGCAALAALGADPQPVTFTHMADASAGEWLGEGLFVAASDEDNVLRDYRLSEGGAPVAAWDASPLMALEKKSPEMDIEGSAKIGDVIYWITSHAPNREGKPRPNRRRFFATRVAVTNGAPAFQLVGRPVTTLLTELSRDPRYAVFGLAAAALRPPKTPGSLNIEALSDTPEGGLLIGARSPVPSGKALLAPLANPAEAVAGQPPRFGEPQLLDLGGDGLRAMLRDGDGYLIVSGSPLSGGTPHLYRWRGDSSAPLQLPLTLPADATPEGLLAGELGGRRFLLALSDDGTRTVDGLQAKDHPDPRRRTFRGFFLP